MRPPNADLRRREYLTEAEVERLMEAAKGNWWGFSDGSTKKCGGRQADDNHRRNIAKPFSARRSRVNSYRKTER